MRETPRTARFWIFFNGGFVKLSIPAGELCEATTTEGKGATWTRRDVSYYFDGKSVHFDIYETSSDCDGERGYGVELICDVSRLAVRDVCDTAIPSETAPGKLPAWACKPAFGYRDEDNAHDARKEGN